MSDLRQRVPGHSLIDELLHQWDLGRIHFGERQDEIVIDDDARGWYRGVIGERRIASLLAQLGDEWTVLHSVPVGGGDTDIDHIAIGPAGVFTINTKYSPGKDIWVAGRGMFVGGHRQPHVLNAIREAERAAGLLSRASGLAVPIRAVIVFVDPAGVTHKAAAGSDEVIVRVVSDDDLLDELRGEPVLTPHELARTVDAAVRPATWHQSPRPSTIGGHIEREFAALEAAVGPRLAAPIGPASKPRAPRTRATRRASSRPTSRGRGKRKASAIEKLLGALVAPAIGLAILWALMNYLSQR